MMLARWLQMSVHVLCTYEYTSFVCEIHPKGNQSWMFIGRTDAKATSILWPPHVKSWLIGKDPDAGRDWGQEEKGTTEDEMAGWHHGLDGHEFEWTLGVGDGQGGLACCDSWGRKELDMTERLNWTEMNWNWNELNWTETYFILSKFHTQNYIVRLCGVIPHQGLFEASLMPNKP